MSTSKSLSSKDDAGIKRALIPIMNIVDDDIGYLHFDISLRSLVAHNALLEVAYSTPKVNRSFKNGDLEEV